MVKLDVIKLDTIVLFVPYLHVQEDKIQICSKSLCEKF